MEKCNCWCEQFCADGKSKHYYCIGTKEWDPCLCGGDRSKCDFYENVREKANIEREESTKELRYFEWNSMDTIPVGVDSKNLYFLVCYIENGDVRYCAYDCITTAILERSYVGMHAVAWCYIEQPKNLMTKEEAIKNLKNAGIFDEAGNLVPIYEGILVKIGDL